MGRRNRRLEWTAEELGRGPCRGISGQVSEVNGKNQAGMELEERVGSLSSSRLIRAPFPSSRQERGVRKQGPESNEQFLVYTIVSDETESLLTASRESGVAMRR